MASSGNDGDDGNVVGYIAITCCPTDTSFAACSEPSRWCRGGGDSFGWCQRVSEAITSTRSVINYTGGYVGLANNSALSVYCFFRIFFVGGGLAV